MSPLCNGFVIGVVKVASAVGRCVGYCGRHLPPTVTAWSHSTTRHFRHALQYPGLLQVISPYSEIPIPSRFPPPCPRPPMRHLPVIV